MPHSIQTRNIDHQAVFLGTGTSHGIPVIGCPCATCHSEDPRNRRTRCSVILGLPGGNLLIDTPPDLRIQLTREGIGIAHAVLFTHAHADHLFGLDDCRIFADYLGHSLPIYCQAAVEARIREAFSYAFDERVRMGPGGGVPRLTFHSVAEEPFEALGARILPIPLRHGRATILGYRIGTMAYCTDTNEIPPESLNKLEGLDLLVLDCLRHRAHSTHLNLAGALAVVERLRPRRAFFTHMCHDLEHAATSALLPAGVELAFDGQVVPLVGLGTPYGAHA